MRKLVIDPAAIDWTKPNLVLAKETGASPSYLWKLRKQLGIPNPRRTSRPPPRPRVYREHTCPVCGKVQMLDGMQRNYGKRVTCGDPACVSAKLAVNGQRLAEIRLPEWQERKLAAHKASPRSGPHDTHHTAKEWHLVAPDGTVYKFRNLAKFLRERADLFDPADLEPRLYGCRAFASLSSLRPGRRYTKRIWKDWTWGE